MMLRVKKALMALLLPRFDTPAYMPRYNSWQQQYVTALLPYARCGAYADDIVASEDSDD